MALVDDDLAAEEAKKNPFFKRVMDSQRAWAQRVVGFTLEYEVPPDLLRARLAPHLVRAQPFVYELNTCVWLGELGTNSQLTRMRRPTSSAPASRI